MGGGSRRGGVCGIRDDRHARESTLPAENDFLKSLQRRSFSNEQNDFRSFRFFLSRNFRRSFSNESEGSKTKTALLEREGSSTKTALPRLARDSLVRETRVLVVYSELLHISEDSREFSSEECRVEIDSVGHLF
jgi:hypothetical protein